VLWKCRRITFFHHLNPVAVQKWKEKFYWGDKKHGSIFDNHFIGKHGSLSSHFIGKHGSIFDNHETANQKAQELFRAKIENESKYIKATISEKFDIEIVEKKDSAQLEKEKGGPSDSTGLNSNPETELVNELEAGFNGELEDDLETEPNIDRFDDKDLDDSDDAPWHVILLDVENNNSDGVGEIVQIALKDVMTGKCYSSYVKPQEYGRRLNWNITKINYEKNCKNAPEFPEVWRQVLTFLESLKIGNLVLVAHNIPFDLRMLRQCWARHSIDPFEAAIYLDILPIFRAFNKESSTPAPNAKVGGPLQILQGQTGRA